MITFLAEHWLDIVTTVLGLAYILLEYRASVWMWLVGFLMQSLGIILYYQKGLYADCGMEFYYLAMTMYGWWRWVKAPAKTSSNSPYSRGEINTSSARSKSGHGQAVAYIRPHARRYKVVRSH